MGLFTDNTCFLLLRSEYGSQGFVCLQLTGENLCDASQTSRGMVLLKCFRWMSTTVCGFRVMLLCSEKNRLPFKSTAWHRQMAFLQIFITVNREKSGTVQSVLQRYDYRTAQNNQYESTAKVTQKTKRFIPDKGNQGIRFLVLYHEPGVVVTVVTKNLQHTNWKILFSESMTKHIWAIRDYCP